MRILVLEDDAIIASGLEYSLQQEGFAVTVCDRCEKAIHVIEKENYDMVLLDLCLPDGSGYDICKKVKDKGDIPVIFLTAVDNEVNTVMGLDMGADDYITKPFRIRELISRIKSVLRRYHKDVGQQEIVQIQHITVNLKEAKVYKHKEEVLLTAMEYKLLLTFINNRSRVLSRIQLLEGIWDVSGDFVNDNTLTVYIKRLREKLEVDAANPTLIKTVRGLGYIMEKE